MGAMGNAGGDMGLAKVPIVGGFFNDPSDRKKVHDLQSMYADYMGRRPQQAQAYMNSLQNRANSYGGAQICSVQRMTFLYSCALMNSAPP